MRGYALPDLQSDVAHLAGYRAAADDWTESDTGRLSAPRIDAPTVGDKAALWSPTPRALRPLGKWNGPLGPRRRGHSPPS